MKVLRCRSPKILVKDRKLSTNLAERIAFLCLRSCKFSFSSVKPPPPLVVVGKGDAEDGGGLHSRRMAASSTSM